jgi:predicted HTH domain antitoxin
MTKTMSIRMDQDNFEFLSKLSKEETGDVSKAARDLIQKGRLMLAVEQYKKNQVSLGKAAELAGRTLGDMINVLAEYGVKSNLETEDYLKGLSFHPCVGHGPSKTGVWAAGIPGPQRGTACTIGFGRS